ncbi:MAG: hypothetical protein P9L89_05890 [Candidatus Celaenobacter polaris]|nr:hypothetical protein [Candidatus Celaenobacter polaris]
MEKVKCYYDMDAGVPEGEWIITKDNELLPLGIDELESDFDVKESFVLYGSVPGHTTYWLCQFCYEHHPEIDFDKEFETNEPGVFARYQEKFGHDYEEWVAQAKYDLLKEELAKSGYEL